MIMRQLEDFNPNLYASTPDYKCIITFNEQTYMDKTLWTIRSHFIAAPILFLCAVKLCYFPYNRKACSDGDGGSYYYWSSSRRQQIVERLAPLFLFLEAMSHGFLGLYHLTVTNAQSQNYYYLLESVAQMFGIFASVVFFLFAVMVVMSSSSSSSSNNNNLRYSRYVQFIWRLGVSLLWLAVIYAYMVDGSVFLGISLHMYILVGICMLLLLAYGIRIYYYCHSSDNNDGVQNAATPVNFFFKSLALLLMIVATAYAYNVYRKCGSYGGYLECFIRCPLPGGLNHNSFYNLAKVLSLSLWAMAEDFNPSVSLYQLALGLRTDDATVISDGAEDLFDSEMMDNKEDDEEDENDETNMEMTDQQQGQNVESSNDNLEAKDVDTTTVPTDIESQPNADDEALENTSEKTFAIGNGSPANDSLSEERQVEANESQSSPSTANKKETDGDDNDGRDHDEAR